MKTVVVFSGGLDSTVLLYDHLHTGDEVLALSIDYGQRHSVELDYAEQITSKLQVEWQVADLSGIKHLLAGSSQTDDAVPVPHGHYEEESMKQTVVPNRNMIMLSVAGGWAISQQADRVSYGAHGGDHAIYPDCRPPFAEAIQTAFQLADWHSIELYCPFINWTKEAIVARGAELEVEFAQTWSCYEGGTIHCGECGTCTERKEAFVRAKVQDPTAYQN